MYNWVNLRAAIAMTTRDLLWLFSMVGMGYLFFTGPHDRWLLSTLWMHMMSTPISVLLHFDLFPQIYKEYGKFLLRHYSLILLKHYVIVLVNFIFCWTFVTLLLIESVDQMDGFLISYLVIVMFYQIFMIVCCGIIDPNSPYNILRRYNEVVKLNSTSGIDSRHLEASAIEDLVPPAVPEDQAETQPGSIGEHTVSSQCTSGPSAPPMIQVVINGEF